MRLYCFSCGKSVSTDVPDDTIFRAVAQCPECVDETKGGMNQTPEQISHEVNAVADLIKERDELFLLNQEITREWSIQVTELRAELQRVSKAAAELRAVLELSKATVDCKGICRIEWKTLVSEIDAIAKVQSPPEPPASTSGTAAPVEAGPAPCASDPPAYGISDTPQASLIDAPETAACMSGDELLTNEEFARIARTVHALSELRRRVSSATPPTGGMPGSDGALKA